MTGFFVMRRGWMNHPALSGEPFTRAQAFVWIVEQASYADRPYDIQGKTVVIKRGQFCASIREMADAWGWLPMKVQRYLTRLKTDTLIDTANDTGRTVITVCNYDEIQSMGRRTDTAADTVNDTRAIQQRYSSDTQKKEGKKGKEGKEPVSQGALFAPPAKQARPSPKRGWPEGWEMGDREKQQANDLIVKHPGTRIDINLEWSKFQSHHQMKGNQFSDWNAAWRTWIGNAVTYAKDRAAATNNTPPNGSAPPRYGQPARPAPRPIPVVTGRKEDHFPD